MILNLSIVLIAAGLILVLYALVFGSKNKSAGPSAKNAGKGGSSLQENTVHELQSEPFLQGKPEMKDDVLEVPNLFVQENDETGENSNEELYAEQTGNQYRDQGIESIPAIMYEDSSGTIDYDGFGGSIDSSLSSYNDLKLIGEGILKLEKQGLSFNSNGKLFRFDFYKIAEVHGGDSFVALRLSAASPVRLFLLEHPSPFIHTLMTEYRDYKRQ